MIKEKIQKILDSKYFIPILIIIINAIFFVICNKLFTPKYEQVDDFIIMNLISKMDGNFSIYGVQMHPIICSIIILLYKTGININWYTIFLLAMQFISFTIIGTVFVKKNKIIGIILYISFLIVMYSKMLMYIQYTTVSMLCITSGFILLMYSMQNIENISKPNFIISILMILFGCMIRFSTIIIAVPFIIIYFGYKFLKENNIIIFFIVIFLTLLIFLINLSFNIIYNMDPTYREFLEFHDVRTYLHDYNWLYYDNNEEIFESINWSENDRNIFYAYCFGDNDVFNTDTLQQLREVAINNQTDTNILDKCINTFRSFCYYILTDDYKFIFLIVSFIFIYGNLSITVQDDDKKDCYQKIFFSSLIFITIIGMHCLFIFLNRPMFRVVISIYIIGITLQMYLLLEKNNFKAKEKLKAISVIFILFISILELTQNVYYAKHYDKENYSVYKDILEYTSQHKENAYLYTLSMKDRYLAYSIYEKVPDNIFSNVRPLGDWDTYTQNYYDFSERYNIDNLIQSLYKNDNVYLISGNVIWGEEYKEYINIIIKYIKEHYNIDVECSIIKEFKKDIKIYKIQENINMNKY